MRVWEGVKNACYILRMELKTLDGDALHEKTLQASRDEKNATLYLLECLHEVDVRGLYLERACGTLFQYVHEVLGYSEPATSERIGAMRLMYKVEAVKEQMDTGAMTMTAVARVATHVKRLKLNNEQVAELLPSVIGKSSRKIERELLAREVQAGVAPREVMKPVSATQTKLSVTLDDEVVKLLEQARDLDSDPAATIAEVLKKALSAYVAQKQHQKSATTTRFLRAPEVRTARKVRYIPRATRRQVWSQAQGSCEFIHEGKRCGSTRSLTIEHVVPYSKGGTHETENLKLFCWAHNQHTAQREFGEGSAQAPALRVNYTTAVYEGRVVHERRTQDSVRFLA